MIGRGLDVIADRLGGSGRRLLGRFCVIEISGGLLLQRDL